MLLIPFLSILSGTKSIKRKSTFNQSSIMSQYITLHSSSSTDRFPHNRGGDFKSVLAETLYLNSSWEVGLSEIIYKRDWPNIRTKENVLIFEQLNDNDVYTAKNKMAFLFKKYTNLSISFEFPQKQTYQFKESLDMNTNLERFFQLFTKFLTDSIATQYNLTEKLNVLWTNNSKTHRIMIMMPQSSKFMDHSLTVSDDFAKLLNMGSIRSFSFNTITSWPAHSLITVWSKAMESVEIVQEKITIPPGYYTDSTKMLKTIEQLAATKQTVGTLSIAKEVGIGGYDAVRIIFTPNSKTKWWWRIRMSKALYEMLGFTREQLMKGDVENEFYICEKDIPVNPTKDTSMPLIEKAKAFNILGSRGIELNRGVDTLWIYADIVKNQITGDRLVPLLRIAPSRGVRGETVILDYPQPHYLPINVYTINTITIKIYNTYGIEPIPFESDVIIKLHFRKRSQIV